MGNWWSGGKDPETSQRADPQRGAVNAKNGGVVNTPQFNGVTVGGNLTVQVTQGPSAPVAQRSVPAEHSVPTDDSVPADKKLLSVRTQFVARVTNPVLDQLLDKLFEHEVITDGEMQSMKIEAKADKARDVIDTVRRKGTTASSVLIATLREADPCLSRALKLL
uniref:CARD domain-containing protein n=1 Tax=Sander lucioperca TaxID=283035 RepID=A0A8C9YFY5_SANLU